MTSSGVTVGGRLDGEPASGDAAPAGDAGQPTIDELGVLRFGGSWLALSPTQESVMRALIGRFGQSVSRSEVTKVTWPEAAPDTHAIDVHIHRLRPRLKDLGLVVHTLRGRGFMLDTDGG